MRERLKAMVSAFRLELAVYRMVLADPRTPFAAKAVLGLAVGYLLMPIDLIPDWLPVIGQLDDLLLVPALVWLALRLIPDEVVEDCRARCSRTDD